LETARLTRKAGAAKLVSIREGQTPAKSLVHHSTHVTGVAITRKETTTLCAVMRLAIHLSG